MAKIILVEDDKDLSGRIVQWLRYEKHTVEHTDNGSDASEKLDYFVYDVIVLDLGLPGKDGISVLRAFREGGGTTPVLILTGQDKVEQKIEGLDAGADDYLTKPFDLRELSARIRTLLRRPKEIISEVIEVADLKLDTVSKSLSVNNQEVKLQPKEYSLIEYFLKNVNKVVSIDEILERIWSSDSDSTSETIYTHMKNLRKKLKNAGASKKIETVHGAGYVIKHKTPTD